MTKTKTSSLPISTLVWTLPDAVIEDPGLLEAQFLEIVRGGFDGVSAYVRCSRYTWDDPLAQEALAHASRLCRKHGIHYWIGPDPRFISRSLISGKKRTQMDGAELLLFGDSTRAEKFPNLEPVHDGLFNVQCVLRPRHAHMFHEVALEYMPLGLLRCYAVRNSEGPKTKHDVHDITGRCHFFYNARDRYVEAFGTLAGKEFAGNGWSVLPFFHVASSQVDYSNRRQMARYASRLRALRRRGIIAGSLMWDEPGYTCTYGSLPFTAGIRRMFQRTAGFPLDREIWKLAVDAADGSHVAVRHNYFAAVQKSMNDAQRSTIRTMRQLWGRRTVGSVHDTWHFESADMCDMNHGSLDLWKGAEIKRGGFVDLGAVNDLREPTSRYYDHLAALSVIAASLGRHSAGRYAYNNLWTVGDDGGAGWQTTVMDHCVNVMALFGTRWIPHAYGPVGTIGEEASFLGSPPLPGYPNHTTWKSFPEWNRRLREHIQAVEERLPLVNVLLVFPLETMYALADTRANDLASALFSLTRALIDAHYQVDIVSTQQAASGRWVGDHYIVKRENYDAVILPFTHVADRSLLKALKISGSHASPNGRVLFCGVEPAWIIEGKKVTNSAQHPPLGTATEARPSGVGREDREDHIRQTLEALERLQVPRLVRGPDRTWVTVTQIHDGLIVTVVPSRHGYRFEGTLGCTGMGKVSLPPSGGLIRVLFKHGHTPEVIG